MMMFFSYQVTRQENVFAWQQEIGGIPLARRQADNNDKTNDSNGVTGSNQGGQ